MINVRKLTAILMTTVFSYHQLSFAQKVENTGNASIVTYEKDYFAQYNSVTLLDMLQIIPGVNEILDKNRNQYNYEEGGEQSDRGFGSSGDQILIDGKRLAGKANNINNTLGRISAESVEKIELIRGVAEGLDVQSQGLVINITRVAGTSASSTFWKVAGKYFFDHDVKPTFLVSHSGSADALDYTFSVERKTGGYNFTRDEQFFNGSGVKTADQLIDGGFGFKGWVFNTNLGYTFADGGVLRINGLYEPGDYDGADIRDKTSDALRPDTWNYNGDWEKWEVGGDYTRSLGSLGQFKALFVLNGGGEDNATNRLSGSGAKQFQYNTETITRYTNEKILRASITTPIASDQSLEWGGEVAINKEGGAFLNIERDADADPFLTTIDDHVDIKENRYEIFAHHTYNISSNMVVQSSLTTEFSKIIADNLNFGLDQAQRNTSFTYLKPRINLRYDVTDRDQLRLTAEKKVSQLDFRNFVTSFNPMSEILEVGNTTIRPEKIWEFSATYEHRFANDGGSIEIEGFYHDFKDHITKIDFSEYENFSGQSITAADFFSLSNMAGFDTLRDSIEFGSKSGNVDSATSYGVKLRSSIRLGFIGVPQAVIGLGYTYEKKETTDQFTLLKRTFDRHSDHTFTFNFRHDITDFKLSYGFNGEVKSDRGAYDINYYWPINPGVELTAFGEYNVFDGIKLRVEFENIINRRRNSTFIGYSNHTRFNDSWGRTEKLAKNPTEVTVSLQGTF